VVFFLKEEDELLLNDELLWKDELNELLSPFRRVRTDFPSLEDDDR